MRTRVQEKYWAHYFRKIFQRSQTRREREKTVNKRPPPYAPSAPFKKRAEIDIPPWPGAEILYLELPMEEGMYPIVCGTFEANLTITEDELGVYEWKAGGLLIKWSLRKGPLHTDHRKMWHLTPSQQRKTGGVPSKKFGKSLLIMIDFLTLMTLTKPPGEWNSRRETRKQKPKGRVWKPWQMWSNSSI